MAGLMAARVLLKHFENVTILDRDRLPDTPEPRKGVPQARHVHVLMLRGRRILEELFPGFEQRMFANGAIDLDMGADIEWLSPFGWGLSL
jgi:hypothetical protein